MDIGQLIKQYRKESKLSLREFAARCGVSHSYIAMLETRKNSKTGEPIIPTISKLNKIAIGMGMSVNDLLVKCDDMPISLAADTPIRMNLQLFNGGTTQLTEDDQRWLELGRRISPSTKEVAVTMIEKFDNLSEEGKVSALIRILDALGHQ